MPPHAILSPSHIYTWGACPGAAALEKDMPPQEAGPEAELGTRAHRLAELRLRGSGFGAPLSEAERVEFSDLLASADSEMMDAVYCYQQAISYLLNGKDPLIISVEERLPLNEVTGENASGTADFLAIVGETLHIVDFKYGENIRVPGRNPQLLVYAIAALRKYDPESLLFDIQTVTTTVVQPRMLNEDGKPNIVSQSLPREKLEVWAAELKKTADVCFQFYEDPSLLSLPENEGALRPSEDACRWCRGKAICPAYTKQLRAVVKAEFERLPEAEHPTEIPLPATPETMAKALEVLPVLRKWADAVEKLTMSRMLSGGDIPGFKLVEARAGNRKWSDEAAAERILRNALGVGGAFEKKLISPAKAEKAKIPSKQWQKLQEFIKRDDPRPAIAPVSDKRPDFRKPDPRAEFSETE